MDSKTVGQKTSKHEDTCLGRGRASHTDKVGEDSRETVLKQF